MLKFTGKGKAFTCGGVTRRDFLQVGTLGAIGFGCRSCWPPRQQGPSSRATTIVPAS